MTKQEEIDHFLTFISSLPEDGYLREIFNTRLVWHIVGQIRNDFTFIDPTILENNKLLTS